MQRSCISGILLSLILCFSSGLFSRESSNESAVLKSGRVVFMFYGTVDGEKEPIDDLEVILKPAYTLDGYEPYAVTDSSGKAVFDYLGIGNYLMIADDIQLGIFVVSDRSKWSECVVIIPDDYPINMKGRPELSASETSDGLVLYAQKVHVEITHKKQEPVFSEKEISSMDLNTLLKNGLILEGIKRYEKPKLNSEKFTLGLLQALDGLQKFSADMNSFSYSSIFFNSVSELPILRVVMKRHSIGNVKPSPEKIGVLFKDLKKSLQTANRTLSTIDGKEFKVEVNLSTLGIDFDGNGVVSEDERFVRVLGTFFNLPAGSKDGEDIIVKFDSADAAWLKGYTHLLSGLLEIITSYNWRPVWDQCAHLVFSNPEPQSLIRRVAGPVERTGTILWADLIATLHSIKLEITDKKGLLNARDEFKSMVECSRLSWKRILVEKDNDHEWIPSPVQTGPGGIKLTMEEINGWLEVLNELEDVLDGKKLLPHWRMSERFGVNFYKMVKNPPLFDLVLLIHGSALVNYTEKGIVSNTARWRHLVSPFGSGFLNFALWVN